MSDEGTAAIVARLRKENIRGAYGFIGSHEFQDFYPGEYRRVRGTVDLHVHVGVGRQEPVALTKLASEAGMRALVFKSFGLKSTAALAVATNAHIRGWAEINGVSACEVIGGSILSKDTPCPWPDYVVQEADAGSRVIWFPVVDSANHMMVGHGVDAETAAREGLSVLTRGSLTAQADETLHAIKEHGMAVSFGHASKDEFFALAARCAEIGLTRTFVDHPFSPVAGLTVRDMAELGQMGVTMNLTNFELSPYCGVPAAEIASAVREIGTSAVAFSSDSGLDIMPHAIECSRLHTALLDLYGFSEAELREICSDNPRRIAGIPPD